MPTHKQYRIAGFEIVGDYTLRIHFDDGGEQTIDFLPVLYGLVFGPLRVSSQYSGGRTCQVRQ